MSRLDDERIADILEAADELALVVARGHEAYEADPLLRRSGSPAETARPDPSVLRAP